jgi:hypothetical protein
LFLVWLLPRFGALALLVDALGIVHVLVGCCELAFDFASMIHQDLAFVAWMTTAFTMDEAIASPGW